jgi:arylsulfatase A-like enzyme
MAPDLWENETRSEEGYLTDLITDKSIKFIERSAAANRSFFVDVAYNAPTGLISRQQANTVAPAPAATAPGGRQYDDARRLRGDGGSRRSGVGKILATLDRLGVTNNTIVIHER